MGFPQFLHSGRPPSTRTRGSRIHALPSCARATRDLFLGRLDGRDRGIQRPLPRRHAAGHPRRSLATLRGVDSPPARAPGDDAHELTELERATVVAHLLRKRCRRRLTVAKVDGVRVASTVIRPRSNIHDCGAQSDAILRGQPLRHAGGIGSARQSFHGTLPRLAVHTAPYARAHARRAAASSSTTLPLTAPRGSPRARPVRVSRARSVSSSLDVADRSAASSAACDAGSGESSSETAFTAPRPRALRAPPAPLVRRTEE
jgi:hypothetical protein